MSATCYFCYHNANLQNYDPLGSCFICGIFACHKHGDYFTQLRKYKCINCQGKWLIASAISTQKQNVPPQKQAVVSAYLGDDYPINWGSSVRDDWALSSSEDLLTKFPAYKEVIDQITQEFDPDNINQIFDFNSDNTWFEDPLLSIVAELWRRDSFGHDSPPPLFRLLITFAALKTKSSEATNAVAPYLQTISNSLLI